MSKGSMIMSGLAVAITGGYFAYQQFGPKEKESAPARSPTQKKPGSSAERGSHDGSTTPDGEAGSADGTGDGSAEPPVHKVVRLEVPNLVGMTPDKAIAELVKRGFKADILEQPANLGCTYDDERVRVPIGAICNQERDAGTIMMSNAKLRVVVEHDTYEHGGVEVENEWHRMPDVTGMPLDRAKDLLRDKGFADDEFVIGEARSTCGKDVVCDQRPKPETRKYANMPGELNIGN